MRPEATVSAAVAVLLALAVGACGADDEPSTRAAAATATVARTTTAALPATTATPAAPIAASGATAVTPGVTGQGDARSAIACQSASGLRNQQVIGAAGATTPLRATTTPVDATTSPGETATTPTATTATPVVAPTTELPATEVPGALDVAAADQAVLARPFSTTSPWNTPIDTRVVDPRSREWIERASRRIAVVVSENRRSVATTEREARDLRLYVNTCAWTPAIVAEDGGETVRIVCRQRNCGPVSRQVRSLRVPTGVDPFPEFDGWYSVVDESAKVGYDMWRARRVGDVISYQFIKRWALDGPGFSRPASEDPVGAVGARGSGLPLFAGVIQPSELRQGRIDHALALSVPGPAQRIFVQPASVTNGVNVIYSLPEGSRLRLKSSFRLGRLPRGANRTSAEAIVTALRTYGAIVVDRSIAPTLYARRSTNYGRLLAGNELQGIRLDDLEVVASPPLRRFPPLATTFEAVQG